MRSKNVLLNIFSNLVLQMIIVIYGFVVPKVIIQYFGSNVNGLVASITQFLAYIVLLESGVGPVVKSILYKPISKKDNTTIEKILKSSEQFFRTISYIFLVYIAILCFVYPLLVSNNFGKFYTISLIIIIGMSTFAEYFFGMTYRLLIQADQKNYIVSIIQIVTYILCIFCVLIMSYLSFDVHFIKFVTGVIFVMRPLFQNYYVKKHYNIDLKNVSEKYEIKQKWDGLAQHVAYVIHTNTDITILTLFTSLTEVSVYSIYYLVIKGLKAIIQSFITGIDSIFGDMLAKNEQKNLCKKFNLYEIIYNMINVIIFSSALVLIVPFVSIYTKNIVDADYIRPTFAALLVISEYIWGIRQPYNELVKASGHFKETKAGAWIECGSNIVVSILLVRKYGLIGVAIGTIFAMTIRTIEFIYHTNKYILCRSVLESIKKVLIVIIETLIIVIICKYLPFLKNTNYFNLIINAIMVLIVASIITIIVNCLLFKKELNGFISNIVKALRKKL